jgi:hypothetical protein
VEIIVVSACTDKENAMGCHLAENAPLKKLSSELDLPLQCHSFRRGCRQGLSQPTGEVALGAPGAVLGYCQALFGLRQGAAEHSTFVRDTLREINAPWWASHELFWQHKGDREAGEFLDAALQPLLGSGRIPVVITGLDPAADSFAIEEILDARPACAAGETILFRLPLKSVESIPVAVALLHRLLDRAREEGVMPAWWPLFQANFAPTSWQAFRSAAGSAWSYANVAVNPFTHPESFDVVRSQVTVAQLPIGLAEGMSETGQIHLAPGMVISGAPDGASWNINDYANTLRQLPMAPTLIVLGPSLPEWTDDMNRQRLLRFLPLLQDACTRIWKGLPAKRRDLILGLAA